MIERKNEGHSGDPLPALRASFEEIESSSREISLHPSRDFPSFQNIPSPRGLGHWPTPFAKP